MLYMRELRGRGFAPAETVDSKVPEAQPDDKAHEEDTSCPETFRPGAYRDPVDFLTQSVDPATATARRKKVLKKIAQYQVSQQDWKDWVASDELPPIYRGENAQDHPSDPVTLFQGISDNAYALRFLAWETMRSPDRYREVKPSDLGLFLNKNSDILSAVDQIQSFLSKGGAELDESKDKERERSMNAFLAHVYGDEFSRYLLMVELMREAEIAHPKSYGRYCRESRENDRIQRRTTSIFVDEMTKAVHAKLKKEKAVGASGAIDIKSLRTSLMKRPLIKVTRSGMDSYVFDYAFENALATVLAKLDQVRLMNEADSAMEDRETNIEVIKKRFEDSSIRELTESEREGVIERLKPEFEAWSSSELLTEMESSGVQTDFSMKIGGDKTLYVSRVFSMDESSRIAVIGFVCGASEVVPVVYYLSNSHAIWKHLPGVSRNAEGEHAHYSKGEGENRVALPASTQRQLFELAKLESASDQDIDTPSSVISRFVDLSSRVRSVRGDYFKSERRALVGIPRPSNWGEYAHIINPEHLEIADSEKPDFTIMIANWEIDNPLYGKVLAEAYPSRNGLFCYTFHRDTKQRVWIANIDCGDSDVTSDGLNVKWVDCPPLTVPALDYGHQSLCRWTDFAEYPYGDTFPHYLSKLAVIREYCNAKGLEIDWAGLWTPAEVTG